MRFHVDQRTTDVTVDRNVATGSGTAPILDGMRLDVVS